MMSKSRHWNKTTPPFQPKRQDGKYCSVSQTQLHITESKRDSGFRHRTYLITEQALCTGLFLLDGVHAGMHEKK